MDHPVVIAGAGPVGLMLACELGLARVDVVVLDRLSEPSRTSPGKAINSATIELLDQRGLMTQLRDGTFELPSGHFSLLWLDASKLDKYRTKSIVLPQTRLEAVLEKRAVELGAEIRRGLEVTGFEQDDSGVTVAVRSATGDEHLRGDYLVGCDGEGSTVRAAAGIEFAGSQSRFHGLVGDIRVEFADLAGEHFGARLCPPLGVYTGAPIEPGVLRITTAEFDTDPPAAGSASSPKELRASIERLTGVALPSSELIWLSRYRNVTRQAERYRRGRVFLAGDAAHVHFPLSGLALNTGIQDAVNLGWKLAAEVNGWAPPGLLDTYHDERHPAGRRACACAKAQVALMHPLDAVGSLREIFGELMSFETVNSYLLDMVLGYDVRYEIAQAATPLAGRRLPHVPLTSPTGVASVAELLHAGRGVLLTLGDHARDLRDKAAAWADRVDVIPAELVPEIDAAAVLLRPDGHVAWTTPRPAANADAAATPASEPPASEPEADSEALRQTLTTWFGPPARL